MRKLLPIILALMLTGCAGTNLIDTTSANSPIPKGMARLLISRDNSMTYFGYDAVVDANNEEIAVLGRGGAVIHDVEPGKVSIGVHANGYAEEADQITAKPGKTYRFMIKPVDLNNEYSPTGIGIGFMLFKETKPPESKSVPCFRIVQAL